jgi:hypothetical protein
MQGKKRKLPLSSLEVVSLVIMLPVIYLGSLMLIFGKEYHLPWRIVSGEIAISIILVFDVIWIIMMSLWPPKITRAKLILTLLVLTLSAIALTDLYLIYTWRKMW